MVSSIDWFISMLRLGHPEEINAIASIDDDASTLYADAGISMAHLEGHPFALKEQARWLASARAGRLFVWCDPEPVAFAALGTVDGRTHLEQLSVRRAWMRRGLGRMLVSYVMQWKPLTLTTYDHLPWNRPYYEKLGFDVLEDPGPELREMLHDERGALPLPKKRVAMIAR